MEKTVYIDGKPVKLKSTAATPRLYRAQFGGSDFFADILKLLPIIQSFENGKIEEMSYEDLSKLSFEVFENIIWVLAKTANRDIPEPLEWLDQFETLDLETTIPIAIELIENSFSSKKNINHPTNQNR